MAQPAPFGPSAAPRAPTPSPGSAAHYRVAMELGLDGYAPLDEQYRQAHMPSPGAFVRMPHGGHQPHPEHHTVPMQHHRPGAQQPQAGQFGILAPTPVPVPMPLDHQNAAQQAFAAQILGQDTGERSTGPLNGRIVVDPPDLQAWRQRLFDVDDMIILTHDEFEVYFPHVDNVYSHRSTQKYKRKPFVSHYWDCRMKGRPPGTPKSDDPNKKKRKRSARERDLCDVKIKITEYFAGAGEFDEQNTSVFAHMGNATQGQRFWTIQRVNGNGGNGKGDGAAGPHRHTLERSDEIKKNSVQRYVARQETQAKKTQKVIQRKATGAALVTAKRHARDNELKLYGASYCPFSQRVWIALEAKGLGYQYCETDPYKIPTPAQLTEVNSQGRVPVIRHGEWTCPESAVILEYLEELDDSVPLFPQDPQTKARCRLWVDHINTNIVPTFFALLRTQDGAAQTELTGRLRTQFGSLVSEADPDGPFFLGPTLGIVDIHLAPFALRLARVLGPVRGWLDIDAGAGRWSSWLEALEADAHVRATTSGGELYVDTAEVLARWRPTVAG